jgi:hypothetical protein
MSYHRSKTIDNVHISIERKQESNMRAVALTIDNGEWEVVASSLPFPNPRAHPGKALLNLKIAPKEVADTSSANLTIPRPSSSQPSLLTLSSQPPTPLSPNLAATWQGYEPEKDVVAPHGIIGQSYDGDGVGIDGATDEYTGEEV